MLRRQNEQSLMFSSLKVSQLLLWMSFLLVIASLCFREQAHVLVEHCVRKIFAYFPCANFLHYPLLSAKCSCMKGLICNQQVVQNPVFKDLRFYSLLMLWCWGPKINLGILEETQSQHSLSCEGLGKEWC